LFSAVFGLDPIHGGPLLIDGPPGTIPSPTDALRPNIGMGFLPEDRKTEALFVELNGKHNASLPIVERFCRFGLVQGAREESAVAGSFGRVEVDRRALWTPVKSF